MFDFYAQRFLLFVENLECCKIPHSFETELDFEMRENQESESEMSDFSDHEVEEIDKMISEKTSVYSPESENVQNVDVTVSSSSCPISADNIRSCIPEVSATEVQLLIKENLNNLIYNQTDNLNKFLVSLFGDISKIFDTACGN